jgi:hypothetical protein
MADDLFGGLDDSTVVPVPNRRLGTILVNLTIAMSAVSVVTEALLAGKPEAALTSQKRLNEAMDTIHAEFTAIAAEAVEGADGA